MDQALVMWSVFGAVIVFLLALDLGVLHRTDRAIGVKESLAYSAFYIAAGLAFGGWIWFSRGESDAALYWTGFVVEKTLSIDNIFAISLVFTVIGVAREYQYRVLFWGILGAIVLRGVMIGLGAHIVASFHWVLYIFAAFLIFTGINMLFADDEAASFEDSKILKFCRKYLHVTDETHGHAFTIRKDGKLWFTPLALALVVVNAVDIIFAVDSVPAVLALTTDPYLVFTSNIFAILGLRALYFALDAMLHRFEYLKYALSVVLVFIGGKIFAVDFFGEHVMTPTLSLVITVSILAAGIFYSLYRTRKAHNTGA